MQVSIVSVAVVFIFLPAASAVNVYQAYTIFFLSNNLNWKEHTGFKYNLVCCLVHSFNKN